MSDEFSLKCRLFLRFYIKRVELYQFIAFESSIRGIAFSIVSLCLKMANSTIYVYNGYLKEHF